MKHLLLATMFFLSTEASVRAMQSVVSCTGDSITTSYNLYASVKGAAYAVVASAPTCNFTQVVDDTGETCFMFEAQNANGKALRTGLRICLDPTKMPPSAPTNAKVQ